MFPDNADDEHQHGWSAFQCFPSKEHDHHLSSVAPISSSPLNGKGQLLHLFRLPQSMARGNCTMHSTRRIETPAPVNMWCIPLFSNPRTPPPVSCCTFFVFPSQCRGAILQHGVDDKHQHGVHSSVFQPKNTTTTCQLMHLLCLPLSLTRGNCPHSTVYTQQLLLGKVQKLKSLRIFPLQQKLQQNT